MRLLKALSIRVRLVVIIAGSAFALIILGLASARFLQEMSGANGREVLIQARLSATSEIGRQVAGMHADLHALAASEGRERAGITEGIQAVRRHLAELEGGRGPQVEGSSLPDLKQGFEAYAAAARPILDPAAPPERRRGALAALDTPYLATRQALEKLHAEVVRADAAAQEASRNQLKDAIRLNTYLAAFFIVCGAGVGVLIGLSIDSSLKSILRRVHDLADGEGDLTQRINISGRDELTLMAHYINRFIGKAHATVSTSIQTANETAQSSGELAGISRDLAGNVANQCSLAESSSNLMTDVARNLDVTEEMSISTAEALQATESLLRDFVATLNNVGGTVIREGEKQAEIAERMGEVSRNAVGISKVVGILAEIADQTNLLALNASVEAAHAKEAGKGFAVVAGEIRRLASRTQNSLEEIGENVSSVVQGIASVSEDTARASEQMVEASQRTRALLQSADSTGGRLRESVQTSSELVKRTTYIATRTKELMEIMNELVALSHRNQESAQGVGSVSSDLARKADGLKQTLNHFKVA